MTGGTISLSNIIRCCMKASLMVVAWDGSPWLMINRTGPSAEYSNMLWNDNMWSNVSCFPNWTHCHYLQVQTQGMVFSSHNKSGCNDSNPDSPVQCIGIYAGARGYLACARRSIGDLVTGITSNTTEGQKEGQKLAEGVVLAYLITRLFNSTVVSVPENKYIVCGHREYKWLPPDFNGLCTIARLTPATFILPYENLNVNVIPKHTLYKRAADNIPRPNGKPHLVEMSDANKFFSTLFIYPMIMQTYDKLVMATDYLDDQIWEIMKLLNTSDIVQNQLIIVTKTI
ncbi:uncharacterized protein LOC121006071 [Bufo bufo]|uniref:uncharacterized protein LOC121006071 n=1 Tax=Bufo bufo TaxID=8384 RepID=UPI001ABE7AA0|nr:uncharacterized protein LOC121006071 [Bufo bufo]